MISDDAPDPRNGKIIQCRVLARTLWVPWAGSLAGPWREAPCHYAAGLHHPHQYPIFGAPPQRGSTNPPAPRSSFLSPLCSPLLSFFLTLSLSLFSPLLSSSLGRTIFHGATILRRRDVAARRVNRREKVFRSLSPPRPPSPPLLVRSRFAPSERAHHVSTVVNSFQGGIERRTLKMSRNSAKMLYL